MRLFAFIILLFSGIGFAAGCDGNSAFHAVTQSHKKAYVKAEYASLRLAPSTVATRIEALPYNTEIRIINQTSEKRKIGGQADYWYLVRLTNGVEGWIYGSGISFSELPATYQRPEPEVKPDAETEKADNSVKPADEEPEIKTEPLPESEAEPAINDEEPAPAVQQ